MSRNVRQGARDDVLRLVEMVELVIEPPEHYKTRERVEREHWPAGLRPRVEYQVRDAQLEDMKSSGDGRRIFNLWQRIEGGRRWAEGRPADTSNDYRDALELGQIAAVLLSAPGKGTREVLGTAIACELYDEPRAFDAERAGHYVDRDAAVFDTWAEVVRPLAMQVAAALRLT